MSTVPPGRSWPPRLRALLRAHLSTLGITGIPKDMVIRYQDGPEPCIEVRHRPAATERCSVHDKVTGFDGSPGAVSRFLETGTLHAQAMLRRNARIGALHRVGHDVERPPMHAVEAHPLVVFAHRMVEQGKGGVSAWLEIENGLLRARPLTLTIDGMRMTMSSGGEFEIAIGGTWPDAVVGAMAGRRLCEILSLPPTHDRLVDDAVRGLVISTACGGGGAKPEMVLRLLPVCAVAMCNTPPDEDGAWKDMTPGRMV